MLKCVLIRISYSVYTTATTKWHHCHALLYDALVQWMHGCYTLVWFLSHIIWSGELERIWLTYHLLKVYEMAMVRFLEGGITATLVRCIKAYSVSCCGNHFLLMIHLRTLRLLIFRRWFWRSRSDWQTDLVSSNEYDLPLFAEGLRNGNCSISWRYATEFGSEHGRRKLLLGFAV